MQCGLSSITFFFGAAPSWHALVDSLVRLEAHRLKWCALLNQHAAKKRGAFVHLVNPGAVVVFESIVLVFLGLNFSYFCTSSINDKDLYVHLPPSQIAV